jgi:hypothetical protein
MLLTDEPLVSHENTLRVALMLLSLCPGVLGFKEKTMTLRRHLFWMAAFIVLVAAGGAFAQGSQTGVTQRHRSVFRTSSRCRA